MKRSYLASALVIMTLALSACSATDETTSGHVDTPPIHVGFSVDLFSKDADLVVEDSAEVDAVESVSDAKVDAAQKPEQDGEKPNSVTSSSIEQPQGGYSLPELPPAGDVHAEEKSAGAQVSSDEVSNEKDNPASVPSATNEQSESVTVSVSEQSTETIVVQQAPNAEQVKVVLPIEKGLGKYRPTDFAVITAKDHDRDVLVVQGRGQRQYISMDRDLDPEVLQEIAAKSENFFAVYGAGRLQSKPFTFRFSAGGQRDVQDDYVSMPGTAVDWTLYENLIYAQGGKYQNAGLVRAVAQVIAKSEEMEVQQAVGVIEREGGIDQVVKKLITDPFYDDGSSRFAFDAQGLSEVWLPEGEVELVTALSEDFAMWLLQTHGWDQTYTLMQKSNELNPKYEKVMREHKQQWLQERGASFVIQPLDVPVRFPANAQWMRYESDVAFTADTVKTRHIDYAFDDQSYTIWGRPQWPFGYAGKLVKEADLQIEQIRAWAKPHFGVPEGAIVARGIPETQTSTYDKEKNEILLSYGGAIAREYAHSILEAQAQKTNALDRPAWLTEGLVTYWDKASKRAASFYEFSKDADKDSVASQQYREGYIKWTGDDAFPEDPDAFDVRYDIDINAAFESLHYTPEQFQGMLTAEHFLEDREGGHSAQTAASFINYLIRNYSERAFYEVYRDPSRFLAVVGKDYKTLKTEWTTYLEGLFGSYLER